MRATRGAELEAGTSVAVRRAPASTVRCESNIERGPEADGAANPLHDLQRRIGNRATLLAIGAQRALQVGAADDPYEREADRIADHVVTVLRSPQPVSTPVQGDENEVVARSIRRRTDPVEPVGLEGGDVSTEIQGSLAAARGRGTPLAGPARQAMEGAFGADFGAVRVHEGSTSRTLNEQLGAKAFTLGNDIFFRSATPNPASSEGAHLLAHELAHTVQQSGSGVARSAIRRLVFHGTNWQGVTKARLSDGGAGGVAFLNDAAGPALVVKAGEEAVSENVIDARLINQVVGGAAVNQWTAAAPDARIATAPESQIIKQKLIALLPAQPDANRNARQQRFLANLDSPGTIVYGQGVGEDYKTAVQGSKVSQKGMFGTRKARSANPLAQMLTQPAQMELYGRVSAADIVVGNSDRITGMVNTENWMIDASSKRITLIDNVQMQSGSGILGDTDDMSAEDSFISWTMRSLSKWYATNDVKKLAQKSVETIRDAIFTGQMFTLRKEDKMWALQTARKNTPKLETWFAKGFAAGRTATLASLQNVDKLVAGTPVPGQKAIMSNLLARAYFLNGQTPDKAWANGSQMAAVAFRRRYPMVPVRQGPGGRAGPRTRALAGANTGA